MQSTGGRPYPGAEHSAASQALLLAAVLQTQRFSFPLHTMGKVVTHTVFLTDSKMSAPLMTRLLFTDCPIFNNSLLIFLSSHKWDHELFIPGSSLQTMLSNEPLERTKWESTRCMTSSKSSSSQGRTKGWHQLLPSLSPSPKPHSASCLGISETSAEQKDHIAPFIQRCC